MPLLHMCRCGALIPQGVALCDSCAAGSNGGQSRHMEYNRLRRDKRAADFYASKDWQRVRARVLTLYDGVDIYALYEQHRVVTADIVHHVVEISEDWERRLDVTNLLPLSNSNHGIISALYTKSDADKRATQNILFDIIKRHWKEAGGIEKYLF